MESGSQRSYLTTKVKQDLRPEAVSTQRLSIAVFSSMRTPAKPCDVVNLTIRTRFGPDLEVSLFVVPHICNPLSARPVSTGYQHLSGLNLADHCSESELVKVNLLIGSDVYWDVVTGEIIRGASGPVVINTRLGWVLSGPVPMNNVTSVNFTSSQTLQINRSTDVLEKELQSFWELESFGIREKEDSVQEQFTESVRMVDGRYPVSLPWREYHETLPTNHELSLKRLHGLLRRLRREPELLAEYDKILREQLAKGIVESMESGDAGSGGTSRPLEYV